jgi:segregation and condensation protein B
MADDHMNHEDDEPLVDEEVPLEEENGSEAPPVDEGGFEVLAILEAMLFASPEPLSLEELAAGLPGLETEALERCLLRLGDALKEHGRGLQLERIAGGFRLVTKPELAAPLRALFRFRNQKRLTPATLDVLAIVAYAQPITSPEIQEIRGTDPSYALRVLQERRLIRIVGRKRVVGRPILYGTTREFLLHFGLDSLEDLPPVEGYGTQVVPAQQRLFPVTENHGEVAEGEDLDAGEDPAGDPQDEEQDTQAPHAPREAEEDAELDAARREPIVDEARGDEGRLSASSGETGE